MIARIAFSVHACRGGAVLAGLCAALMAAFLAARTDMPHHAPAATPDEAAAARPASQVRVIDCQRLPNVPGKSITTALVDMPPGAFTPAHRHPGSVSAIVVLGTVRSQLNGGPILTYGVSQAWFEPPGTLHSFAENPSSTAPARILATFVADENCGPLTIFE